MTHLTAYDINDNPLRYLYQWDTHQHIKLKSIPLFNGSNTEVDGEPALYLHFANKICGTAYSATPTVESAGGGLYDVTAEIPDALLSVARPIYVYLYEMNDAVRAGYKTTAQTKINVIPRQTYGIIEGVI